MKAPESYAEFLALPDAEREALVKTLQARGEPKHRMTHTLLTVAWTRGDEVKLGDWRLIEQVPR